MNWKDRLIIKLCIHSTILLLFFSCGIKGERIVREGSNEDKSKEFSFSLRGRRLQHKPYYNWYFHKKESLETINGKLPTLSCPLGTYRDFGNVYLRKPGGLRLEGCLDCPKGRYGSSHRLKNSFCTAPCPRGTYRDQTGGTSVKDCTPCPEGTFGEKEGLTTRQCSGQCTSLNIRDKRYYSNLKGLTTRKGCKECPEGYRCWQCRWSMDSPEDNDHHYENGNENI